MFCLNYLEVNRDSSLKEDELLAQEHTDQAADETQTQTVEEGDPMTVHFAVNCKLQPFSSSHEYLQSVSHCLNMFYEPWGSRANLKDEIENKAIEMF